MKPTMLLVSQSPTTSVGLKSYLNHIFGNYIHIEACLAEQADTVLMKKYDLVLLASKGAMTRMQPFLTQDIHWLLCSRTLNFTYLHRILSIPPNSEVYLVNDSRSSALLAIRLLHTFGITQYHFIPWNPDGQEVDESIQYAVTLGEMRFVPKNIPTVVDIGVRVADISTIAGIIAFFELPMSLADVVTNNYINQFVRLLKTSNHQLSQSANMEFITQSIINNIDTGICIVDEAGLIRMVNTPFIREMRPAKSRIVGTPLEETVPDAARLLNKPMDRAEEERSFVVQELQDANHKKLLMIRCEERLGEGPQTPFYHFYDYCSGNGQVRRMLETAKRISLTDYCLLIQGEMGTGKEVLAQAIHNNSSRSRGPFVKISFPAMSEEKALELLGADGEDSVFSRAAGGTLYLEGVHCLSERLQKELLMHLNEKNNIRFLASTENSLYEACLEGRFLKELFYRLNEVSLLTVPIRERVEDIPLLFEYFIRNIYNNSALSWSGMLSEGLQRRLLRYSWPGNGKEIENLCKYFYCVRSKGRLSVNDLPPYMQAQMLCQETKLAPVDRQILTLVSQNPKTGRKRLRQLMEEQGTSITEGKVRSVLQTLAERELVRTNRTKGGCEITEEGLFLL